MQACNNNKKGASHHSFSSRSFVATDVVFIQLGPELGPGATTCCAQLIAKVVVLVDHVLEFSLAEPAIAVLVCEVKDVSGPAMQPNQAILHCLFWSGKGGGGLERQGKQRGRKGEEKGKKRERKGKEEREDVGMAADCSLVSQHRSQF